MINPDNAKNKLNDDLKLNKNHIFEFKRPLSVCKVYE